MFGASSDVMTGRSFLGHLLAACLLFGFHCQQSEALENDKASEADAQCLTPLERPGQPLRVTWNNPDNCYGHWDWQLSDFGIEVNDDHKFLGNRVQLFYRPGKWPYYTSNGSAVNGGLPQAVDPSHFQAANATFSGAAVSGQTRVSGLGVIDFEKWRPLYITNYSSMRMYQEKSKELVRREPFNYFNLNDNQVEAEAEKQFNMAARYAFEKTLKIGKEVSPMLNWGYYLHPRVWDTAETTVLYNDRLAWLWRASTGLYPSLYAADPLDVYYRNKIARTVTEALRVQKAHSRPNTPVHAYVKFHKNATTFYAKDEMAVGLGLPALMGVSGLVLWGSSSYYRPSGTCDRLSTYIRDHLGPYVAKLIRFAQNCSTQHCSGNGRCALTDEAVFKQYMNSSEIPEGFSDDYQDYKCNCYFPWTDGHCGTQQNMTCLEGTWQVIAPPHTNKTNKTNLACSNLNISQTTYLIAIFTGSIHLLTMSLIL